jgi:cyclase
MVFTRVIPCLLLRNAGLVKTVKFSDPSYVGDPINTVRIFNEAGADELVFLDIFATPKKQDPQFELVEEISRECFMPFAYGGGLRSIGDVRKVLANGAEKAILNTSAWSSPDLVREASKRFGSQSIVVSIDVKTSLFGKKSVRVACGKEKTGMDPVAYARQAVELGAGEILLTSIDQEGTYGGYDLELIRAVSATVDVPVVANGGARNLQDIRAAVVDAGASASAAGSLFIYQGANRAVLINYPARDELDLLFN